MAKPQQIYFDDPQAASSCDVNPICTSFQQRVWRTLPGACRSNPVPIVVPCRRVVAADGAGDFMGATRGRAMDIKTWLAARPRSTDCLP